MMEIIRMTVNYQRARIEEKLKTDECQALIAEMLQKT
jgi:DNA-binding CsgD family transcriptional regulator